MLRRPIVFPVLHISFASCFFSGEPEEKRVEDEVAFVSFNRHSAMINNCFINLDKSENFDTFKIFGESSI